MTITGAITQFYAEAKQVPGGEEWLEDMDDEDLICYALHYLSTNLGDVVEDPEEDDDGEHDSLSNELHENESYAQDGEWANYIPGEN